MNNEVLDRSMQAAKNLMKIEIKDRYAELSKRIHDLKTGPVLRSLDRQCKEILESEKSEIVSNCKWLQDLVEATQTAMYGLGQEYLLDPDEQGDRLEAWNSKALTDDNGIIISSNILCDLFLEVTGTGSFKMTYTINSLLIPWAEDARFSIHNYPLQKDEAKVFTDRENHRTVIENLEEERRALHEKEINMDDVLLRVETDLLLKQIKADAVGGRSIDTIKELMGKYLDNKALPEGMKLIK